MSEQTMKKKQEGLIHIYCGGGKGKTTAAIGLACRAAGRGRKVVFCQFMKGSETGEISALARLGVTIVRSPEAHGFLYQMDAERQAAFETLQQSLLADVTNAMAKPEDGCPPELIVMDEALDALLSGLISEEALRTFVDERPKETELVFTGRQAPVWLEELAGYITDMTKKKHPWDSGIVARKGIEY
ncbi:MAG: cob(I)yrinic acid a,c-diamide adenosyltransferase [Clostridiales Family XIII bacterium]|nr:cob(I)yrinic acid a,c-diamide adenosyltransferase [Clostridiales Family XIII bacterium]